MAHEQTIAQIKQCLTAALEPSYLEVIDESYKHIGHPGAKEGGHFQLTIQADILTGKSRIEQHRLIYTSLGQLMKTHIHALSIQIMT